MTQEIAISQRIIAHDYRHRFWGHDYFIDSVQSDGQVLTGGGWGRGIEVGHYILFEGESKKPDMPSIYKAIEIRYSLDPSDMFFATFAYYGKPLTVDEIRK